MDNQDDGDVVGSYRIHGPPVAKAGSQGRVFRAVCIEGTGKLSKGEVVALKEMHTPFENDKQLNRAMRTVNILRANPHPGIVGYHDFFIWQPGSFSERQCVVMDFLEGETLADRIAAKPKGLDWEEAYDIFLLCAEALGHAKSLGIIHRDLKPSNIYLCHEKTARGGKARIIDFEIARNESETQSTHSGLHGSFDYMAPEFHPLNLPEKNFSGDEISDVYSFCVCFYETLTGSLPYKKEGSQGAQSFFERFNDANKEILHLSRSAFKPIVGLQSFLQKGLAFDRNSRFQSFQELQAAFRSLRRECIQGPENKFIFEKWVGRGGFAEVYKAKRESDGEVVAVKCLRRCQYASQFIKEARLLRSCDHPNIVKALDFFRLKEVERYFLVMEYLPGMPGNSLRGRLKSSPNGLPFNEAIHCFAGYLDALDTLHVQYQIIHRDIKPGNLYAPENRPSEAQLLDLGIARDMSGTLSVGPVPGTFEYMAPEFGYDKASRGSPQSDLFSLGLCLFETLTGNTVYPPLPKASGASMAAFFERSRTPAVLDFSHPVFDKAPGLKNVFRVALAHHPGHRFSSAEQFRSELISNSGLKGILPEEKKSKTQRKHAREERISGPDDTYILGPKVGKGGFADVYKATRESDGLEVALKCLRRCQYAPQFIKEARLVQDCNHPYIVKALSFFQLKNTERYFLVMEYLPGMPGSSLRGRINQQRNGLPIDEAVAIFARYLSALDTLHVKYSIIHRDIKPGNLYAPLHQPDGARLLDLGVARDLRGTHSVGPVHGTLEFMAPEFALHPDTRGTPQTDIYALGLCFYEVLTGRSIFPPLPQSSDQECFQEYFLRSKQPPKIRFEHPVFAKFPNLQRVVQNATAYETADRYRSAALFFREMVVATGMRELNSTIPLVSDSEEEDETQFLDFEIARSNLATEVQAPPPVSEPKPPAPPTTRKIPETPAHPGLVPGHGNKDLAPALHKQERLGKQRESSFPKALKESDKRRRVFSLQVVLVPLTVFLMVLGGAWGFYWFRISGMEEALGQIHPELLDPERTGEWLEAIQRIQQTQRWASQNAKLSLIQLPVAQLLLKSQEKQAEIISGLEIFTSREPTASLKSRIQAGEQLLEYVDVLTFLTFSEEQRFHRELEQASAFLSSRTGQLTIDLTRVEGPVDTLRFRSVGQGDLPVSLEVGVLKELNLPYGEYSLELVRDGYETLTFRTRVAGEPITLSVRPQWEVRPWLRHLLALEESLKLNETGRLISLWDDPETPKLASVPSDDIQERFSRIRQEVEARLRILNEETRLAQEQDHKKNRLHAEANQMRSELQSIGIGAVVDIEFWADRIQNFSSQLETFPDASPFGKEMKEIKSLLILASEQYLEQSNLQELERFLSTLKEEAVSKVFGSGSIEELTLKTQQQISRLEIRRSEEERLKLLAKEEEERRLHFLKLQDTFSIRGGSPFEELEIVTTHLKAFEREKHLLDSNQQLILDRELKGRRSALEQSLLTITESLQETIDDREKVLSDFINYRQKMQSVLSSEIYRTVWQQVSPASRVSLLVLHNRSPQDLVISLSGRRYQVAKGEQRRLEFDHGGKEIAYALRIEQDGFQEKRLTGKLAPMEGKVIQFDQALEVKPVALQVYRDSSVALRVKLDNNWREVAETNFLFQITPPSTVFYEWTKPDYLALQGHLKFNIGDADARLQSPASSEWKPTPALLALNQARDLIGKDAARGREILPSRSMEDPNNEKLRLEMLKWLKLEELLSRGEIGKLLEQVGNITALSKTYPDLAEDVQREIWKLDENAERIFVHNHPEVTTYRIESLKGENAIDPAIHRAVFQIASPVAGNLTWVLKDIEKEPEFRVLYERKDDADAVSKIHLFYMEVLKSLPDYSIASEQTLSGLIQEVKRDEWRPSDFALAAFCEAQLRLNRWESYESAIRNDLNPFDESRILQVVRLSEHTQVLASIWERYREKEDWRKEVESLIKDWGELAALVFPVWRPPDVRETTESLLLYSVYAERVRTISDTRPRANGANSILNVFQLMK